MSNTISVVNSQGGLLAKRQSTHFDPLAQAGDAHMRREGSTPSIISHTPATAEKVHTLDLIEQNSLIFRADFMAWIDKNWVIWNRFKAEADKIWGMGRSHYSARTLVEFIRHETTLKEPDGGYKINNSYIPDCGRLYGLVYPERDHFFECRTMVAPTIRNTIRSSGQSALPDPNKLATDFISIGSKPN